MSERTPDEILDQLGRDLLAARPHRARANVAVLAIAVGAIVAALSFTDAPPDREVAVTPTPTVSHRPMWPPSVPTPDPSAKAKVLRATPLDLTALAKRKWVRDVLDGGSRDMVRERLKIPPAPHEPRLAGAWSVTELKGEVLLVDDGTMRCLSVPDPATAQPQIERGSTCARSDRWISLGMGDWWVGVVDPGTRAPVLRQPDGSRENLDGSTGLIVLADRPAGTRVTLFDGRGKPRGDSAPGAMIPWSCDDGRQFMFDPRRLPTVDPCAVPAPPLPHQTRRRG